MTNVRRLALSSSTEGSTILESRAGGSAWVTGFFDERTSSVQYVVADTASGECAVIDPVLDYDEKSGSFATDNADRILDFVDQNQLRVRWALDTHPHADHCSAIDYIKSKTGARTAIGAHVVKVQQIWKEIYNWSAFPCDGSQWDELLSDGQTFEIGSLSAHVIHSPGHTLASVTVVVGDCAFVHDTLFMPDGGTARADFPGGDAGSLWRSIQKILQLPDDTRVFTGHDYQPGGRAPSWESNVGLQRALNIHLTRYPTEGEFVDFRKLRDATLSLPRLMLPALQVNIDGGRLPTAEANGRQYLKLPIGAFPHAPWD